MSWSSQMPSRCSPRLTDCVWCIWPSRTSGRCDCLSYSRFCVCVPSVSWRHSAEDWSVVKSRNTRFFFFLGILGIVYLYPPPSLLLLTCLGGLHVKHRKSFVIVSRPNDFVPLCKCRSLATDMKAWELVTVCILPPYHPPGCFFQVYRSLAYHLHWDIGGNAGSTGANSRKVQFEDLVHNVVDFHILRCDWQRCAKTLEIMVGVVKPGKGLARMVHKGCGLQWPANFAIFGLLFNLE